MHKIHNINLKIPTCVKIYLLHNQKFLVSSTFLNRKFIKIPNYVSLFKKGNELILESKNQEEKAFIQFIKKIKLWLRLIDKPFRKKIFLKGLGYKAMLLDNKTSLDLKIGFSHSIQVYIPTTKINLKINKKVITIKGCFPTEVGNFTERIRKLRVPDRYKGKGIWYKNELITLKVLKKK